MSEAAIVVDPASRTVTVRGQPVELSKTEFAIVATLGERRFASKRTLLREMYRNRPTPKAAEAVLWTMLHRVRAKLEAAGMPGAIQAVTVHGYSLATESQGEDAA